MKYMERATGTKHTPGNNNRDENTDNKDGFGVAAIMETSKVPYLYKQTDYPYNLPSLPSSSECKCVVAHMRHKNYGAVSRENTQPFVHVSQHTPHLFAHNGKIFGYEKKDRDVLMNAIHEYYRPNIKGDTDSELLFYLLLSCSVNEMTSVTDIKESVTKWLRTLMDLFPGRKMYINFVYSNKKYAVFGRFAIETNKWLSMYYDHERGIVSSEPVTETYSYVPENTCWRYRYSRKHMVQVI